jgi:tRNA (guanine-N7-)-methyltransferase
MASAANFDLFCTLLAPGGSLHIATDIDDYAVQVRRLAEVRHELDGGVVDRPTWRPVTRYERKGLDAGRAVTDLIYRRR